MFQLESHQVLLDKIFEQKNTKTLHHSFIFRVKDAILIDRFINSLSSVLLDRKIDNYNDSAYITVANIDNDEIKLAEVKKIIKNCELAGHNNGAKIIIIEKLELLNDSAANALLKTLEEPTENTFFLMFTNDYYEILDTVKSRSLTYDIFFTEKDKIDYLKYTFDMSEDAIAKSMRMARNDVNIIARIKLDTIFWQIRSHLVLTLVGQMSIRNFLKEVSPNYKEALYWLLSILIDIYYYNLELDESTLSNYDRVSVIKHLAAKHKLEESFNLYKKTLKAKEYFSNFKNVDKELVLENLLLEIVG
ncbi:DNA polymerase III subunit delta' C-terminal domain-containing protein [Pseudofrancisella aestuarii]|uniref:DNA polymerase III subunit delta' n=1 Tax=Pseudofrancisella aestuarii TaxID=2670347 RepID=A0ABV9TB15_9GAMM|nr:DNA polymerase III subunit delta' C-terminal domain-containing protein [Pseudofrancisella aestuarii]